MHFFIAVISKYRTHILFNDLPLRLAEFGSCHRNEPSGTLHGIMRVRNFVQDDGHIFCSSAQIQSEVSAFIDLTFRVYKHFGFENVDIKPLA
jgi:threonyl-tRNA synthetase